MQFFVAIAAVVAMTSTACIPNGAATYLDEHVSRDDFATRVSTVPPKIKTPSTIVTGLLWAANTFY